MAKLVYPIETAWKGNWGPWEALRELIQNALDAADGGDTIKMWMAKNGTINIVTEGHAMTRSDLVLGASSKRDGSKRGRKGEGLKIAALTLVRLGCRMTIRTGDEIWTPIVEPQEAWGGKECLVIETRKNGSPFNGVKIEIDGFSRESYDHALTRVVDARISPNLPAKMINVDSSTLFVDPKFAGLLFVGSLFVADLSKAFGQPMVYGFNFDPSVIELDSDRKLADPWTLRYQIGRLMADALKQIPISQAYDALSVESFEAIQFGEMAPTWDPIHVLLTEEHDRRHGNGALAAHAVVDQVAAAQVGAKAVITSKAIAASIGNIRPLAKAIETAAKGAKRRFDRSELDKDAVEMIDMLEGLRYGKARLGDHHPINVVEFWSEKTAGMCDLETGAIYMCRESLLSREMAIATYVHEIAHARSKARDGEPEHIRAIEEINAVIIVGLLGGGR